jgi:hypothetical protein
VLVIIPDIVAAVTGIFNLIMLEADDVGTEIVVGGTVGAAARGLESKVEFVAFDVGDRITCANKYFRLYAFKKKIYFFGTCLIVEFPLTRVGVPITFCP